LSIEVKIKLGKLKLGFIVILEEQNKEEERGKQRRHGSLKSKNRGVIIGGFVGKLNREVFL